ncbi:MAG TPA: nitrilase-related carbon-nitrogen hydrolase [Polyangiaceae bacterium]|nr:nitrilase-related carbon-nitrogen hydrolase [Polyangiaceae bacterium]
MNERSRVPLLLALCSAFVQAHGAITTGHLMWLAAVPWGAALVLACRDSSPARAARTAFGLGAWIGAVSSAHLWGIAYYHPAVYVLTIAYHALVWGTFSAFAGVALVRSGGTWALRSGAAWALIEGARSIGGWSFPFYFGGTLARETVVVQLASVIGTSGLSGLLFWVGFGASGYLAAAWGERRWARPGLLLPPLAFVALSTGWGALRLHNAPRARTSERVAALQGSIPPWFYTLAAGTGPYRRVVEEHYGFLYRKALASSPPPDFVLFPETTFDWPTLPNTAAIRRLATLSATRIPPRTQIVFGVAFTESYEGGSVNGVGIASADAAGLPRLDSVITKHQLVPLIEMRDRPSDIWQVADAGGKRLGVMICYESMYTEPALFASRRGASLLTVLSDDGGMRHAPIAWTHAEQDRMRAIEAGIPLVRAGQAGVSYGVDAYGRLLGRLDSWKVGALTVDVPMNRLETVYTAVGRYWLVIWAAIAFTGLRLRRFREILPREEARGG